ncbi:hypothetical protein [Nonomuraea sp. KM88]|uniref:hypothetical protein n=1 Tax=Nonomuraea sp. KM88 TaxID=3457427 RepID=UPI003FCD44A4
MRAAIFGGAFVLAGALAGAGVMNAAHAGADVATAPATTDARIPCYDIRSSDVGFYRSVTIKSKCGQTNTVRARIASWPDGPCWTIRPDEHRTHYYRSPGTFYNLTKC